MLTKETFLQKIYKSSKKVLERRGIMKNILCFGDSNTYGYIPDKSGRFPWGVRWTSILTERLGQDYNVIEEGLCGRTTIFDDPFRPGRNGSESFQAILESHNPLNLITIMLGTNDCKTVYGATAGIIGKGVESLLEQIKQHSPKSEVLLISPIYLGERVYEEGFDVEFSKESIQVSKDLENVYEKIADKWNIHFLRAQDYASCSETDQEHLNADGHKKLGDAIYRCVSQII